MSYVRSFSFNAGLIWLLGASILLSVFNLLQSKLTRTYSGLQASAFSIFFGTLMLVVFISTTVKEVPNAPPIVLFYVAILGVLSSAVAYIARAQAFPKAPKSSSVSNYMFVTPFLGSLMGFVFANEKPDTATLIGGGIILSGLFFFNLGEKLLIHKNIETAGQ